MTSTNDIRRSFLDYFGQNGHDLARLHIAKREGACKGRKPFVFDAFDEHVCLQ